MEPIVLFDFDGTLLVDNIHEPQAQALVAAVEETFNVPVERESVDWVGKTDFQLARELLAGRGDFDALLEDYKRNYYQGFLRQQWPSIPVRDGWFDVLPQLPYRAALVTGNYLSIALAKIDAAGLDDRWLGIDRSAFGNDAEERAELVRVALERSGTTDALLVGDTWRDIEAAHANGIKAVGLVTEKHSSEELKNAEFLAWQPADLLPILRVLWPTSPTPTKQPTKR